MAVIADRLDSVALELLDVLTELQSRRRDAHNILANVILSTFIYSPVSRVNTTCLLHRVTSACLKQDIPWV